MTIHFYLKYDTEFGQDLRLNIIGGAPSETTYYGMTTGDGRTWQCDIEMAKIPERIDYFYSLDNSGREERHEWQTITHRLELNATKAKEYTVYNSWTDIPYDSYLYSSAFTDCVNRRHHESLPKSEYDKTLRLIVRAPQLRKGDHLYIAGESSCLGNWHTDRALKMYEHNYNEWVADLDIEAFKEKVAELKFIATTDNGDVLWETGFNRKIEIPELKKGEACVYDMDQAFFEICDTKLAGTLVPVFSLRTKGSFGVGDFGDLKMMIDWVAETKQKVLQVLPINDTPTHTPASASSPCTLSMPTCVSCRRLPTKRKLPSLRLCARSLTSLSK